MKKIHLRSITLLQKHLNPPTPKVNHCDKHLLYIMNSQITGEEAEPQTQHHDHLPVGFVYSKSPSHCVCLGVMVRSVSTWVHARMWVSCKCTNVYTQTCRSECLWAWCFCVRACTSGWSSTSPRQTNPWAIITSSPQLKCLSYFIYAWYTSMFPKTMESL